MLGYRLLDKLLSWLAFFGIGGMKMRYAIAIAMASTITMFGSLTNGSADTRGQTAGEPYTSSVLHMCANYKNWAWYESSLGRSNGRKYVRCDTRANGGASDNKWYVEATAQNGDTLADHHQGVQWIRLTFSRNKKYDDWGTNIYWCGDKSWDQIGESPRPVAAACMEDMLSSKHTTRSTTGHKDFVESLGTYE